MYEDEEQKGIDILGLMTVASLVLSILAIIFAIVIAGPQGPPGIGVTGASPSFQWDGTAIRFMDPNGTWGAWVELKGETGQTGATGASITGPQGPQGMNGSPELNHLPVIQVPLLTGYHYNDTDGVVHFIFNITVTTQDQDNDTVQTIIYYRQSQAEPWKQAYVFFKKNQTVNTMVDINMIIPSNQVINWAVMAWDGRDITMYYTDFMILYP